MQDVPERPVPTMRIIMVVDNNGGAWEPEDHETSPQGRAWASEQGLT